MYKMFNSEKVRDKIVAKKVFLCAAIFLVAVAAGFSFYFRTAIGDTLWHRFHSASAALLFTEDPKLAMEIGNYYFNGAVYDLNQASNAYAKAVAINPSILWGHYQLARIFFVKGDFTNALKEINLELAANPENLRSLYVRGLIYGYNGNTAEAIADFERFVQWAPKEWAGYNDLAWVLSKTGKYQEAKNTIKKAFQEIPSGEKNPWLWNGLGVAELNLGNYGSAEQAFRKAKELAADLTEADWRKSYPGNDPVNAAQGLRAFRDATEENLKRTRAHAP